MITEDRDKEDRFRARLANWDVDEPTRPQSVTPDPEQDLVQETVTAGTSAWQRAMSRAKEQRKRGPHGGAV